MKKKLLAIVMMSVLAFSITACGGGALDVVGDLVKEEEENTTNESQEIVVADDEDDETVSGNIEIKPEEDTSLNLDEAITGALEDEGVEVTENEGTLVFDTAGVFTYNEEDGFYYAPDGYTNINYNTEKNDGSFIFVTQALMETTYEQIYTETFGEEIDITFTNWETIEIDGYEAISYTFEYECMDMNFLQMQVAVNGTENFHYVTFTSLQGSEYVDDFEACIETMKFE